MPPPLLLLAGGALLLLLAGRGKKKTIGPGSRPENSIFLPVPYTDSAVVSAKLVPTGYVPPTDAQISALPVSARVQVFLQMYTLNTLDPTSTQAPIPTGKVFLSEGKLLTVAVPSAGIYTLNYYEEKVVNPGTYDLGEPIKKGEDASFVVVAKDIFRIV